MPAKGSGARRTTRRTSSDASLLATVSPGRQVAWVVAAGAWIFLLVGLASFDAGDWPSHAVAVHNDPPANLCGRVGAIAAYWSYHVMGLGAWLLLAAVGALLVVTLTGRVVTHPVVRGVGVVLMACAAGCLHAIALPGWGPLPGAPAGLVATAAMAELLPRFNHFGSLLIVLAAFGVGTVVAVDRLVLALPRLIGRGLLALRDAPAPILAALRALFGRPAPALAVAGGRGKAAAARPSRAAKAAPVEDEAREDELEDADDEDWDEDEDEDEEDPDADEEWDEDEDDDEDWDEDEEDEEEEPEDELEDEPEAAAPADAAPTARPRLSDEELRAKIAKLPLHIASRETKVARDEDIPRTTEDFRDYAFPTLDLLKDPEHNFSEIMEQSVRDQAKRLEEALNIYKIEAEVVGIEAGPAITLYSVQLAPGTKVAKVQAIASDIARSLGAPNIRIVANMTGKTTIGIEVPNLHREKVRLKELMSGGQSEGMVLPMFLGKDASGEPLVADLTRMPHMLIAGTTGSGKSVCMNTILMSWVYTKRPDELKLVLVDPKMVEMSQFQDIPHLLCPVVTESARAAAIMEWATDRMEERYELLREARVQNIAAYNALSEADLFEAFGAETDEEKAKIPKKLHYIVIVVDELADLMMTCKEVEHSIVRIAQKARAVGIHLILATQRPQATVVTGLIKANMPCRVSFKVASGMDSRIVLDQKGAELLLGQGDMMFLTPHSSEVKRAQGTLIENAEIRQVMKFLRSVAQPTFERSLMTLRVKSAGGEDGEGDGEHWDPSQKDPLFDKAVEVMIETGRGSVSLLQRRLGIGYGRASRLVDQMGLAGILGEHKGSVAREVLITLDEWRAMQAMVEADEAGTEA